MADHSEFITVNPRGRLGCHGAKFGLVSAVGEVLS
jgi:hypothetical protein